MFLSELTVTMKGCLHCFFIVIILIICLGYNTTISGLIENMPLPKKNGEEIDDASNKSNQDDPQEDLVSEFFEHVKEIFDQEKATETNTSSDDHHDLNFSLSNISRLSSTGMLRFIETTTKRNKLLALFENTTKISTIYLTFSVSDLSDASKKYKLLKSTRPYFRERSKPTLTTTEFDDMLDSDTSLGSIKESVQDTDMLDQQTKKLSCILCDNVSNKDCNNPENKLLPLIRCDRYTDICYSMQTPFGVVDRGCYSPLLNRTTYVCTCNLCNSIPMHDLPHTFTNKSEWLYNVQEMSHGRRLRKSVYSQMACIQCEVNQTVDETPDINCLEGKYRVLPSQYCDSDEVCAIIAIRQEGYIWRGCLKYPRYNYLWTFCSNDLCNFEAPVSLFDIQ